MKFTITREQLAGRLGGGGGSHPCKTTLPVLANVLVEASSRAAVCVCRERTRHRRQHHGPAEVDADGAVTLPRQEAGGHRPPSLPSGPVRVTAAGEARVSIESGRSKSSCWPASRRISVVPAVKFEKDGKQRRASCNKLVGHVAFAASTRRAGRS